MDRWACKSCDFEFTADEPRCPKCLRRSTVRPAAAPVVIAVPTAAGEKHWRANAILQTSLIALHVLTVLSVAVNVLLTSHAEWLGPFAELYRTHGGSEEAGRNATFTCIGLWALLGLVWTPLNAYGLWTHRRWARVSTLLYWIGSLATCCCFPVGVYGIWSLLRDDVKAAGSPTPDRPRGS